MPYTCTVIIEVAIIIVITFIHADLVITARYSEGPPSFNTGHNYVPGLTTRVRSSDQT